MIGPRQGICEQGPSRERRLFLTTCLTLLALGVLVRLFRLGTWSLWADEVATIRDAASLRTVIGYPVAYALIGAVVRIAGESEFAARIVPALAGAAAVPLLYAAGYKMFSHRTGLLAAVCLVLSPYHLFFSQFARYYSLLMLLGLLAMYLIQRAMEEDDRLRLVAGLAILGLAFWTHWSAGLLVPALIVQMFWLRRGRERPAGLNRWNLVILFGPIGIGTLVLLPHAVRFLAGWSGEGGFSVLRSGLTMAKILYRMEPSLVICGGVAAWLLLQAGDRRARWLVPYAVVPPVLSALFVGATQGGSRFAIVSLPAVLLLAGAMLDFLLAATEGRRRVMALAVAVIVFLSLGTKCIAYFTLEQGQRPRWRDAVQYVLGRGARGVSVITNAPLVVSHYGLSGATPLAGMEPGRIEAALSGSASGDTTAPAMFLVEHVANVAPTPEQWEALRRAGVLVRCWPLRVASLDYSISLYVAPVLLDSVSRD